MDKTLNARKYILKKPEHAVNLLVRQEPDSILTETL